jgi:hypothetical protein
VSEPQPLSLERIEQAIRSVDPVFLNSPQFRTEPLEHQLDFRVVVKVETPARRSALFASPAATSRRNKCASGF